MLVEILSLFLIRESEVEVSVPQPETLRVETQPSAREEKQQLELSGGLSTDSRSEWSASLNIGLWKDIGLSSRFGLSYWQEKTGPQKVHFIPFDFGLVLSPPFLQWKSFNSFARADLMPGFALTNDVDAYRGATEFSHFFRTGIGVSFLPASWLIGFSANALYTKDFQGPYKIDVFSGQLGILIKLI